jgi:hypothetical protein
MSHRACMWRQVATGLSSTEKAIQALRSCQQGKLSCSGVTESNGCMQHCIPCYVHLLVLHMIVVRGRTSISRRQKYPKPSLSMCKLNNEQKQWGGVCNELARSSLDIGLRSPSTALQLRVGSMQVFVLLLLPIMFTHLRHHCHAASACSSSVTSSSLAHIADVRAEPLSRTCRIWMIGDLRRRPLIDLFSAAGFIVSLAKHSNESIRLCQSSDGQSAPMPWCGGSTAADGAGANQKAMWLSDGAQPGEVVQSWHRSPGTDASQETWWPGSRRGLDQRCLSAPNGKSE